MIWELFCSFFKIGLFTFGGGYAMLPLIDAEVIGKKKWITDEEMEEMLCLSEVTPGPIAINMATLIGYKKGGFLGSVMTTLGVCLPSVIIILALCGAFSLALQNKYFISAFRGIRAGVSVLVLSAGLKMFNKTKRDYGYIISLVAIFLALYLKLGTVMIIILGGIFGIILGEIRSWRARNNDIH